MALIGPEALAWTERVKLKDPYHWTNMARGMMNLKKLYDAEAINLSCGRASHYGVFQYQQVKMILARDLWKQPLQPPVERPVSSGGFGHELSLYDELTQ